MGITENQFRVGTIIIFMKKLTLILGTIAILAFTNCGKEIDCSCITSYTDPVTGLPVPSYTDVTSDVHITEGDCSDINASTSTAGIKSTIVCKTK